MRAGGAGNGEDQRIVSEGRSGRSPRREIGEGVGPADGEEAGFCGEPSVAAAAHPVIGVGESDAAEAVLTGKVHGPEHGGVRVEVAGAKVAVPAFDSKRGGRGLGDEGGFGVDVDAAVGDHFGEAGEAVEAVGVDAVAGGFGEEAGAEGGAVAVEAEMEGGAKECGVEIGIGDAEHGGSIICGGSRFKVRTGGLYLWDMACFLELEHVNVARGDAMVLHDVNLRVEAGEHIAILGPNGCGKSTLIKTMTCELYPMVLEGTRVSIFGRERWDLTELKKRLGVVSPELPGRQTLKTTGRDAVLTGFFSSSTLWPNLVVTGAMRERAEEVLELVGAAGIADKAVGEMSAGEQRRVMIGRALVGSGTESHEWGTRSSGANQMLLLDEPSNALDLAAQQGLREMLRRLAQQGTGMLLITHHIADILPEIGRVILMRGGRIVADGAKRKLLTAPVLSELLGVPVRVTEEDGFFRAW